MKTVMKNYRITFKDGTVKDYSVEAKIVNSFFEGFNNVVDRKTNNVVCEDVRNAILYHIDSILFPTVHRGEGYSVVDLNPEILLPIPYISMDQAKKIIDNDRNEQYF